MGFLLFSMYFKFLALVFLDFMYVLRYGNMVVEYGYIDVLMSLIYGFCWYNAYSTCLHFCFSFLCIVLCFVLCCAYHVHDKTPLRCFCVSLWIPLNIKFVGIIKFLWFWNIKWLCIFTLCPSLHTFAYDAHTHAHWHVEWLVPWIYHDLMIFFFTYHFFFELLFKFQFLGF